MVSVDRGHHVGRAGAAQDQAGVLVDHAIPDQPRLLVVGVIGADDRAVEPAGQLVGDALAQSAVNVCRCRR
jgi:hypothetical protein